MAVRAGVSTATVSRYLRGDRVRSAARIGSAIRELGYTPNPAARSLRSGVNCAVGVVVPDITNPFFAAVVRGIERVSRVGQYNILLCDTEESTRREEEVLSDLVRRVDGIILAPVTEQDMTPVRLREAGPPIVFLDRTIVGREAFDSVLVDNEGGAAQAADYLIGLGHRRLATISGPLDTTPGRGRHQGFVETAQAHDVQVLVQPGDFKEASGYQGVVRLLAMDPAPTAIFTANNEMTVGALKALYDLRIRIPEEISILGFDDLALGAILHPPLTVIDRPMEEQGETAMRLLLDRLTPGDPASEPRVVRLGTSLLVRGSCAPPTSGPPPLRRAR